MTPTTTDHRWQMCACERVRPAHTDAVPDPAGGTGCGMAWRQICPASTEIEERHITDITQIEVQPGGHLRQDASAGLALPNHPAERTRRNRMVGPPEQPGSPEDPRFTAGLFNDVLTVLEAHGYHPPEGDSRVYAHALLALGELVRAFEGTSTDPLGAQAAGTCSVGGVQDPDALAGPGTPGAPEGGDRP